MRDLRMSGSSLLAVLLLAVTASANAQISQAADTTCAVMSGQRKADRQALQYLLLLDEGAGERNPVAIALQREVIKNCPKAYLNYQQRKRGSNPFPAGSLVNPGGALVNPGGPLVKPGGGLVNSGGALVNPGGPLVKPGGALYQPGQGLVVSETEQETRLAIAADLLFDFDKAVIRPDAARALKQAAEVIREKNRNTVRIEGYTDSKGGNAYNMH